MKRIFRSRSIKEKEIPVQAAAAVVKVWMEIHRNDISENIDLPSYLINTARECADSAKAEKKAKRKSSGKPQKTKEDQKDGDAQMLSSPNLSDSRTPQEIIAASFPSFTVAALPISNL